MTDSPTHNQYAGREKELPERTWESPVLMPEALKRGYYPTTKEWEKFFRENP
jgi:hypothetical protein